MSTTILPRLAHLAPVLIVDDVDASVAFWADRFGFEAENKVPGPDGRLMFASVKRDGLEIMYQSRAGVLADESVNGAELAAGQSALLFLTVPDLDSVEQAVAGAPVFKARHTTFYGSTELYVREPGGAVIGFAQF